MAVTAGNRAVGAYQGKLGLRVVETVDVCPRASVMAGLTAEGCAIGAFTSHALVELALMRIFVTGSAGAIFKMEWEYLVGAAGGALFMTIGTRDSDVSAHQGKSGGLVLGDRKSRAMEIDDGVTRLAMIVIGSDGKLIVVGILMTIAAGFKFDLVESVFSGRDMALGAFHFYVHALQRIAGGIVLFYAE